MSEPKKIGFWRSDSNPELPVPIATEIKPDHYFIIQLSAVESAIEHRKLPKTEVLRYRGFSSCRICHRPNGSYEYRTPDYIWPVGLRHYVVEHQVEIDKAFVEWVEKTYFNLERDGVFD